MRIAFVSFETVHHRETETNARARTVVDLLVAGGHDVDVVTTKWWSGEHDTFELGGVTYHAIADDRESGRTFLAKLPVTIARLGPDVVHAVATPPSVVRAANWGATLARSPLVVEWYGEAGVVDDRAPRKVTRWADRIVTPSRLVRTWVRELGAAGDAVEVIPSPIDLDLVRETPPVDEADASEVIYARRLDAEANLESLLLALAELRDRDWRATVVGDGPERDRYESLTADLRIDDRVRFVGETSREERVAIYRAGHAFVQTADFCVFPTELCWALAAGCVGVVEYHADSSAHELVEGRERGIRTTSETELTEAIVAAGRLEHREYDEYGERFGQRQVRERYLDVYRELQAEGGLF